MKRLPQALKAEVAAKLSACHISNALFEAELLLAHFLSISKTDLLRNGEREMDEDALKLLFDGVEKRCGYYPLQYIFGLWEFYGYPFFVDEKVLIPRADTETLVDAVLENVLIGEKGMDFLDLCCGSGCIGIALAKKHPIKSALFCDNSKAALETAQKNAALNNVGGVCKFLLLDALTSHPMKHTFDFIVCNPPYLTKEDMENLQPEVSFEPKEAFSAAMTLYNFTEPFLKIMRRL